MYRNVKTGKICQNWWNGLGSDLEKTLDIGKYGI